MLDNLSEIYYYLSLLDRTQRANCWVDFPWLAHMIAFKTGKLRDYEKHHSEIRKMPSEKILKEPELPDRVMRSVTMIARENMLDDVLSLAVRFDEMDVSGASWYKLRTYRMPIAPNKGKRSIEEFISSAIVI